LFADPFEGQHGDDTAAQAPDLVMPHRFKVHDTGFAGFDGLGAPALKQAPGGRCVSVCMSGFGDLNVGMVILGFVPAAVLMHQTVEGISADAPQFPGRVHGGVRPAQGHGVGMKGI
jgi:hypothetical protein